MSIPDLILTYVLALLGGLGASGIYTEFRKRRFAPARSDDHIFRCENAGSFIRMIRTWRALAVHSADG